MASHRRPVPPSTASIGQTIEAAQRMRRKPDGLRPAKGIAAAIALSIVLWPITAQVVLF
jgi:hypothetical protein